MNSALSACGGGRNEFRAERLRRSVLRTRMLVRLPIGRYSINSGNLSYLCSESYSMCFYVSQFCFCRGDYLVNFHRGILLSPCVPDLAILPKYAQLLLICHLVYRTHQEAPGLTVAPTPPPSRRSTCPGCAPVMLPLSSTKPPLTKT